MSQLGTRKSRRGCRRCKERHVKCDELTPCSACVRRNEGCSLLEPLPPDAIESTYSLALPTNSTEWTDDLELMHHYSCATHNGLLNMRETARDLWRTYIPQEALKHTFLMHGLLAFAALHLAYLRPKATTKYTQLCDKHQTVALKEFRAILSSDYIDPAHADALFALSTITSISSMARSCLANDQKSIDTDAIAEIFFLTRGVRDVIQLHSDRVQAGPMLRMFKVHECPADADVVLPACVRQQFDAIGLMLESYGLDPEALTYCQNALSLLEDVYHRIYYFAPTTQIEGGVVFRWATQVPTGYVRLVQAQNPPALIVLAYHVTAFSVVRKSWYTKDFAEYALRGITLTLGENMKHWMEWPWLQVESRLAALGANPAQWENDSPYSLIEH